MVADNLLNILFLQIGQRNIVTLQKGKTRIIIFKIQCISHTRRHLINKTENTLIMAGMIFIHHTILKFHSQVFLKFLFYLQLPFFSIWLPNHSNQIFFIAKIVVVQYISNRLIIDGYQLISRLNLHLFCNAAADHTADNMFFLFFHYGNCSCYLNYIDLF